MKKLLAIFFTMIFVFLFGSMAFGEGFYPLAGYVFKIDPAEDIVYFIDHADNVWSFYGIDEWEVNDIVCCLMYDCHTANIYDDEVINVGHVIF